MNRSFDALSGSPGHAYVSQKKEDGSYVVTSLSIPDLEWTAPTEREAIQLATKDVYDLVTQGKL